MAPAMPCKRMDNQHHCITYVKAEPKEWQRERVEIMYGCLVESTNPRDSEQNLCSQKFVTTTSQENGRCPLQFGAQVYSDATSDEDSGCESCRG